MKEKGRQVKVRERAGTVEAEGSVKGPRETEFGQPLHAGKAKETDSPQHPEGAEP